MLHPQARTSDTHQAGQAIPLFHATTWAAQPTAPNKKQKTLCEDLLCYAGGAIWSLDWCPASGRMTSSHARLKHCLYMQPHSICYVGLQKALMTTCSTLLSGCILVAEQRQSLENLFQAAQWCRFGQLPRKPHPSLPRQELPCQKCNWVCGIKAVSPGTANGVHVILLHKPTAAPLCHGTLQ